MKKQSKQRVLPPEPFKGLDMNGEMWPDPFVLVWLTRMANNTHEGMTQAHEGLQATPEE